MNSKRKNAPVHPDFAYVIVRHFLKSGRRMIVARGLQLTEAQTWCRNPETSSRTATGRAARVRTRRCGPWFDGYDKAR